MAGTTALVFLSLASVASGFNLRTTVHNESTVAADQHSANKEFIKGVDSLAPFNLHAHMDPHWDKKTVQANNVYQDDFVTDGRPTINLTALKGSSNSTSGTSSEASSDTNSGASSGSHGSHTANSTSSGSDSDSSNECPPYTGGRSMDWYKNRCAAIDGDCKDQEKYVRELHEANLKALQDDYEGRKQILEEKERDVANATDALAKQNGLSDDDKKNVAEAEAAVASSDHCPGDLQAARAELARLESIPNKTPEDIEEECELRKKILELMKCVEQLRKAEELLAMLKVKYGDSQSDLHNAKDAADAAEQALAPQRKRVADAKTALDEATKNGPPGLGSLLKRCQSDKDALKRLAEGDASDLEAEYLRQKRILDNREANHKNEQSDVEKQDGVVAKEEMHVKEARIVVQENINAPEELKKARAELANLEGTPNVVPEDIDGECEAKKRILDAEERVEALWEANGVLSKEKGEHRDEKGELRLESKQEKAAAQKLPPQQTKVDCAKKALDEARAAMKALQDCQGSHSASESSSDESAKEAEPSQSAKEEDSEKDAGKKKAEEEDNEAGQAPQGAQTKPNSAQRFAGTSISTVLAVSTALLVALQ